MWVNDVSVTYCTRFSSSDLPTLTGPAPVPDLSCCSLFVPAWSVQSLLLPLLRITIISIRNYRLIRAPETLSRDCVNRKQAEERIAWHVTIVTGCVTPGDAASWELRDARRPGVRHGVSVNSEVSPGAEIRSREARVTRDFSVSILRAPESIWEVRRHRWVKVVFLLLLHLFLDWDEREIMTMIIEIRLKTW